MERLQHTWDALLSRFGRFTDIQSKAIDPLLAGQNCILVSATASGKTEAALAPLLERQISIGNRQSAIGNLFIVPSRALTRDLARRLEQPLTKLALSLAIKTGDEPALKQNRSMDILLTTPESFDSLLANRPRMLRDVRAVILDEIHLYEDTPRGDQLRVLLNRLRRLRKFAYKQGDAKDYAIQFCALSATIDEPLDIASRYFENPVVIESKGQRAIDAELLFFDGAAALRDLFFQFPLRGIRKVLAFCQSRAECEEFAYRFGQGTPFGERVYAHHANLAAKTRHTVEEKFTTLDAALCFATSTLELGIDIGDVDLIVLIGAPDSTASFLQRIGRGNRRTLRTRVVCFYRNEREHALFRVFLRQARQQKSYPPVGAGGTDKTYVPFNPSVVVQQLFSYIKQTRTNEIEPNAAYELFTTPQGEPLLSKQHYDQIIEHLIAENYFAPSFGTLLKPSQKWEELYERREIYTNIGNDNQVIEIIDEITGRRIGFLENKIPKGSTFLFGGKPRHAKHFKGRKIFVATSDDQLKTKPRGFFSHRLLSPELVRELALELGVPLEEKKLPLVFLNEPQYETDETNRAMLFHCAGYAYGLVLGDLLEKRGDCVVEECDELSLTLSFTKPIAQLNFTEAEIIDCVQRRWRQFENWFTTGRWQRLLPSGVRAASTVTDFQVGKFNQTFSQAKVS
jgi:ATP-dependent Lhr-like helicase